MTVKNRVMKATSQLAEAMPSAAPASAMPMTIGDGAGDDGRQHLVQGRLADPHDQQTDEDLQDAGAEDADLRQPDAVRAVDFVAGSLKHAGA